MKTTTKILALICALLMLFTSVALVSCDISSNNDEETSSSTSENDAPTLDKSLPINISVLNGTTGFGIAKLIDDNNNGKATLRYRFFVESDASNITAALINGSVDIAALPTNAAANLYNKTKGKVQIAAINTLGVLYLVTNNVEINSMEDLKGKTVYCPAQNPAFIFSALCSANGLTPATDVTIDTSFAQPADLRTAVAAGQVDIAVLPEPMVTIAKSANANLKIALDLTEVWESVYGENSLAQGCIVVRTEWAKAHPAELAKFLEEYKASIEYVVANPKEASEMIISTGVFAGKAPVAEKAIPNCNIVYIDGEDMKSALDTFFSKLFAVAPASVGGEIPDDGIYYKK